MPNSTLHHHGKQCRHSRLVTNANPLRMDPTRTLLIRKRFMIEVAKTFRVLKAKLREFLVTLDALGLADKSAFRSFTRLTSNVTFRQYAFHTDAQKLAAFNLWFKEQVEASVLSPDPGTPHGTPWTTEYVESAYRRGLMNAYQSSKQGELFAAEGIGDQTQEAFLRSAFAQPETMSKVQLLGQRAWEGMKGITSTMGSQLNVILAQGIADGKGPMSLAREMSRTIDNLSRARAMTIARTEIIHAHAEGQLDAFDKLDVQELGVMAEWSTAGDERVCPQCAPLEGKIYTVDEARGMIPLHPNCRCSWIPSIPKSERKKKSKDTTPKERPAVPAVKSTKVVKPTTVKSKTVQEDFFEVTVVPRPTSPELGGERVPRRPRR